MKTRKNIEKDAASIASMNRDELTRKIKNFQGRFKLDFTEDYLQNASTDRLRHILLAAKISSKN
jgi:hypothetical protein